MNTTKLIFVGGFLGAGKTTLLWESAVRLMNYDKKIGLVTNDQAPELVDTTLLLKKEMKVAEVSGSCFCCNFNGLVQALKSVKSEADADIILAEPVGSCTDLSATILQPLKKNMNRELQISPLSVLADPIKLSDILNNGTAGLHPSTAYIYKKQLEESDIIVITKTDLIDSYSLENLIKKTKEKFPNSDVMSVSTKTGKGIEEWLNAVMTRTDSGKQLIEVDYDIYAEGEAVMGWLNAILQLEGKNINWDVFGQNLMKKMSRTFEEKKAAVGHVKMILENGTDYMTANLTGTSKTLTFNGFAGNSNLAQLTLNVRLEMVPEKLENLIRKIIIKEISDKISFKKKAWNCLSPGKPEPTFRFNYIVPAGLIPPFQ